MPSRCFPPEYAEHLALWSSVEPQKQSHLKQRELYRSVEVTVPGSKGSPWMSRSVPTAGASEPHLEGLAALQTATERVEVIIDKSAVIALASHHGIAIGPRVFR